MAAFASKIFSLLLASKPKEEVTTSSKKVHAPKGPSLEAHSPEPLEQIFFKRAKEVNEFHIDLLRKTGVYSFGGVSTEETKHLLVPNSVGFIFSLGGLSLAGLSEEELIALNEGGSEMNELIKATPGIAAVLLTKNLMWLCVLFDRSYWNKQLITEILALSAVFPRKPGPESKAVLIDLDLFKDPRPLNEFRRYISAIHYGCFLHEMGYRSLLYGHCHPAGDAAELLTYLPHNMDLIPEVSPKQLLVACDHLLQVATDLKGGNIDFGPFGMLVPSLFSKSLSAFKNSHCLPENNDNASLPSSDTVSSSTGSMSHLSVDDDLSFIAQLCHMTHLILHVHALCEGSSVVFIVPKNKEYQFNKLNAFASALLKLSSDRLVLFCESSTSLKCQEKDAPSLNQLQSILTKSCLAQGHLSEKDMKDSASSLQFRSSMTMTLSHLFLSIEAQNRLSIDLRLEPLSTEGPFILYSYARMRGILERYSSNAAYPPLPEVSSIKWRLLCDKDEWGMLTMLHQYWMNVGTSPRLPHTTVLSLRQVYALCSQLSRTYSSYYDRARVLAEPGLEDYDLMYARIWLHNVLRDTIVSMLRTLAVPEPPQSL